jgi:hypothetical protein
VEKAAEEAARTRARARRGNFMEMRIPELAQAVVYPAVYT